MATSGSKRKQQYASVCAAAARTVAGRQRQDSAEAAERLGLAGLRHQHGRFSSTPRRKMQRHRLRHGPQAVQQERGVLGKRSERALRQLDPQRGDDFPQEVGRPWFDSLVGFSELDSVRALEKSLIEPQ